MFEHSQNFLKINCLKKIKMTMFFIHSKSAKNILNPREDKYLKSFVFQVKIEQIACLAISHFVKVSLKYFNF